jgi:hypothetical protein
MGLNKLAFAIIALYLIEITLFGLRFRKKQRTFAIIFLPGEIIRGGRLRARSGRRWPHRSLKHTAHSHSVYVSPTTEKVVRSHWFLSRIACHELRIGFLRAR